MKQYLFLSALILMASCSGHRDKAPALQMDPDFEPTEPHPFAERIETRTGEKLTADALTLHGDTLGTLIIHRSESDTIADLLHSFTFHALEGDSGTVSCQYNGFYELTDLWIESASQRTHCVLQWNEDGNLSMAEQESWSQNTTGEECHTVQVIEYQYSRHSSYGNWYADMAEQIGGPVAELLHAGLMGRAPWTLPERINYVCSVIDGEMIGEQKTYNCQAEYEYDNNGRVISEKVTLPQQTHSYTYKVKN